MTRAVRGSAAGAEDVERPLAAVREGQAHGGSARALDARRERVRRLARVILPRNLSGQQRTAPVGHAVRISSAARSATITVGQFV